MHRSRAVQRCLFPRGGALLPILTDVGPAAALEENVGGRKAVMRDKRSPKGQERRSGVVRAVALLVSLLLTLPAGLLIPSAAEAQAVGTSGGFMELSSVFFSEGSRTFGPGDAILVSGAIPYVWLCKGMFKNGILVEGSQGEGPFGPFPTADLYVIPDTGQTLGDLEDLDDVVSEGVNRVIGLSSGAFVDELVAVAQPGGNLGAGRFDIVMDQCLDGRYDQGIDIVLGEGPGFAFEVVLPGVLPPFNLHPLKANAAFYELALGGKSIPVPGLDPIEIPGFCKLFEKMIEVAAIVASSPLGIWSKIAGNQCENLVKHWEGIKNDPPDPNFTQFAELGSLSYSFGPAGTSLEQAMRTLAHVMTEQAATSQALLVSLERFQGAQLAQNDEYTILQLEEVNKFVNLLAGSGGSLLRFYAALEALDLALENDPIGSLPEAGELRAFIPDVRRAIGSLLRSMGPEFARRPGTGADNIVPVGLQAWIIVYLGLDPFLAGTGLPSIAQDRAARGLPPIAFQHPAARATGPYSAPPDRAIHFGASPSTDPNADALTFSWDLDGDGVFDDGSGATVDQAFAQPGTRLVGLKATDPLGHTDIHYVLVRIGDVNRQSMIAMEDRGQLYRVAPTGEVATLGVGPGVFVRPLALHVDLNEDFWVLRQFPTDLERYSAGGVMLGTLTPNQIGSLLGISLPRFNDFVLDGRGDIVLLAQQTGGIWKVIRVAKDGSRASVIAGDVSRPDANALGCFSTDDPALAIDHDGNIVLTGVSGPAPEPIETETGVWLVDPNDGAMRELIPAGAGSNCGLIDSSYGPFQSVELGFGGVRLLSNLLPFRTWGGVEVDTHGNYILGFGNTANTLRMYRALAPPQLARTGFNLLLEVFPLQSGLPGSPYLIFHDTAIDSSGDYLVPGHDFNGLLGGGVFRVTPIGEIFKVSDFPGPLPKVLDVVPEVREVTAKDIPPGTMVRLSGLSVNQSSCPGSARVDVAVANTGAAAVLEPIRAYFFDGDPAAGGVLIGSAVTEAPLLPDGPVNLTIPWDNPGPGVHSIFATVAGANTVSKAFMVCVPAPAPGSSPIGLAPASATTTLGTSHTATATVNDLLGRPIDGVPITFEVTGANAASGEATTDTSGAAAFAYSGANPGQDEIVASSFGAVSNTATNLWSDIQPKLIVIKHVINDNGGTAVASSFTMSVTGSSPSPASFPGAESPGTTVNLNAGAYSVSETGPSGYSSSFSADCSGSIAAGQTKTCTITNSDIAPTLTVNKICDPPTDGGLFDLLIDGSTKASDATCTGVTSSTGAVPGNAGGHVVSETQGTGTLLSDYVSVIGGQCAADGTITLPLAQNATCTITNTKKGMAKVIKTVSLGAVTQPPGSGFVFQIRTGASSTLAGTILESSEANSANDGTINFAPKLVPGTTYSLCESVMPGWMTTLGPPFYTVFNPSGDNSTVCTDFTVAVGETKSFTIDNQPPPGGLARTIGFWKNWASCSSSKGGQKPVLDDTLAAAGGHIAIGILDVDTCLEAVRILNKSTVHTGKKMSSDPAFNLAAQLLAAKFNVAAGAGVNGCVATAINDAQALFVAIHFNGVTHDTLTAIQVTQANSLATTLDHYNNTTACP